MEPPLTSPLTTDADIERPPLLLTMLEGLRGGMEAAALLMVSGLLARAPRGDGHTVLVLPGFATDDNITLPLRMFLASRGYQVEPLDLGWNLDHHTVGIDGEHLARRIMQLRERSGSPVSLVGWSLGGVLARETARRIPEDVRQVITLGSPFSGNPGATSLRPVYELLTGVSTDSPATLARMATGRNPLPVPSTAIFSKTDGIAAWENCCSITDSITENIEVHASHFGMVANPAVYHIIADRLAQPAGEWRPFSRKGPFSIHYPGEDGA